MVLRCNSMVFQKGPMIPMSKERMVPPPQKMKVIQLDFQELKGDWFIKKKTTLANYLVNLTQDHVVKSDF